MAYDREAATGVPDPVWDLINPESLQQIGYDPQAGTLQEVHRTNPRHRGAGGYDWDLNPEQLDQRGLILLARLMLLRWLARGGYSTPYGQCQGPGSQSFTPQTALAAFEEALSWFAWFYPMHSDSASRVEEPYGSRGVWGEYIDARLTEAGVPPLP